MVNWFDELSPRTKKWILIVAGIAAVLGPVLFILGNLMKAINGVSMTVKVFGGVLKWLTFSSGPFGLVLIGLTALGTGIYLLIRHWKEVERITIEIWNRIKDNVLFIWDSLFGGIKRTWDRIMGLFTSVKNRVSGVFRGATDWLLSKRIGERQFGGEIPETGSYILHKGERVLPAGASNGITINITGNTFMGRREVAEEMADLILNNIRKEYKI